MLAHARGGPARAENLRLACAAHNALYAERDFGAAFMHAERESSKLARLREPGTDAPTVIHHVHDVSGRSRLTATAEATGPGSPEPVTELIRLYAWPSEASVPPLRAMRVPSPIGRARPWHGPTSGQRSWPTREASALSSDTRALCAVTASSMSKLATTVNGTATATKPPPPAAMTQCESLPAAACATVQPISAPPTYDMIEAIVLAVKAAEACSPATGSLVSVPNISRLLSVLPCCWYTEPNHVGCLSIATSALVFGAVAQPDCDASSARSIHCR